MSRLRSANSSSVDASAIAARLARNAGEHTGVYAADLCATAAESLEAVLAAQVVWRSRVSASLLLCSACSNVGRYKFAPGL